MRILALLTLLLSAADHWTTYLCLRQPVDGWHVTEANPLADWLFDMMGLVPGLAVDSLITLSAVGFLLATPRFGPRLKEIEELQDRGHVDIAGEISISDFNGRRAEIILRHIRPA